MSYYTFRTKSIVYLHYCLKKLAVTFILSILTWTCTEVSLIFIDISYRWFSEIKKKSKIHNPLALINFVCRHIKFNELLHDLSFQDFLRFLCLDISIQSSPPTSLGSPVFQSKKSKVVPDDTHTHWPSVTSSLPPVQ